MPLVVDMETEDDALQVVLGLGADIEVFEPATLRWRVIDTLARAAALYASPPPG